MLDQYYDFDYNKSDTDSEDSVLNIDMDTKFEDVLKIYISNLNKIFTTNQICVIKLIKMLENMECPNTPM